MNFHKTLTIAVAMTATASAMANTLDPNNPSGTVVDRFADIEVMRYVVPGFDDLTLSQKKLIYFLTEAATFCGIRTASITSRSVSCLNRSTPTTPATARRRSSGILNFTSSRWSLATVSTITIPPTNSLRASRRNGLTLRCQPLRRQIGCL